MRETQGETGTEMPGEERPRDRGARVWLRVDGFSLPDPLHTLPPPPPRAFLAEGGKLDTECNRGCGDAGGRREGHATTCDSELRDTSRHPI